MSPNGSVFVTYESRSIPLREGILGEDICVGADPVTFCNISFRERWKVWLRSSQRFENRIFPSGFVIPMNSRRARSHWRSVFSTTPCCVR